MLEGIFQVAGTLLIIVVVLYLAYLSTKYIGKGIGMKGNARYMRIVDQISVGQDRSIAIIKVGEDLLLVGISASSITVLKELEEEQLIEFSSPVQEWKGMDFKTVLEKMGKRKK